MSLASERWFEEVVAGQVCAVTGRPGSFDDPLQGHHVISKQRIKRRCRDYGQKVTDALIYDPANGMPVLYSVHRRHTAKLERIPRSAIPKAAWGFAERLDLIWWMEQEYA